MTNTFNYAPIKLTVPDKQISKGVLTKTIYMQIAHLLRRDHFVVEAAPSLRRSQALDIWTDIPPSRGGYEFEVAVSLPFYLPKFRRRNEYVVKCGRRPYVINNRHCEVIFNEDSGSFYLCHLGAVPNLIKQTGKTLNQVLMKTSIISTRFRASGNTASATVENNFAQWMHTVDRDVPRIMSALRYHCSDPATVPELNNVKDTCVVYLLCKGKGQISLRPFICRVDAAPVQAMANIAQPMVTVSKTILGDNGRFNHHLILDNARGMIRSGQYGVACILACSACELGLAKELKRRLLGKGCSKKKLEDAMNQLRFSQMLDLFSHFLFQARNKHLKVELGRINALRKLRNDIVHKGKRLTDDSSRVVSDGVAAVASLFSAIRFLKKRV